MTYEPRKTDADVLIAQGACVVGDVTLAKGVSVWYNAVIRGDEGAITVGEDTNIQDCTVLHEAVTVGRGCTVGHGAILHGCTVEDGALIGMGAGFAFMTPPGMTAVNGVAAASGWTSARSMFLWGLFTALISFVVLTFLGYPLGSMMMG